MRPWSRQRKFPPGHDHTTGPLKDVRLIGNETWLARTTSLLDMVNHAHIPAGFRQVAPPQ